MAFQGTQFDNNISVSGDVTYAGILYIGGTGTPSGPREFRIQGSDTNIGLDITLKGTGILRLPTGYEANILSDSRAVVNRLYVDQRIVGKLGDALVLALGAPADGKTLIWDQANNKWTMGTAGTTYTFTQGLTNTTGTVEFGGYYDTATQNVEKFLAPLTDNDGGIIYIGTASDFATAASSVVIQSYDTEIYSNDIMNLISGTALSLQAGSSAEIIATTTFKLNIGATNNTGDIYYRNSSGFLQRLAIGAAGRILTVSGGIPAWVAPTTNTFIGLSDVPSSYSGQANKFVVVNGGATGLIFSALTAGTVTGFTTTGGGLSPLFTTNVTNPSTNPDLAFTLTVQSGNIVYASPSNGSSGNPLFRKLVFTDLATTTINRLLGTDNSGNILALTTGAGITVSSSTVRLGGTFTAVQLSASGGANTFVIDNMEGSATFRVGQGSGTVFTNPSTTAHHGEFGIFGSGANSVSFIATVKANTVAATDYCQLVLGSSDSGGNSLTLNSLGSQGDIFITYGRNLYFGYPGSGDGDIFYMNGGILRRLSKTTNGFILTLVGGIPAWAANAGGGGGGGITNTAVNNELGKSDGTNIGPSGFFSTAAGDLIMGTASIAGSRILTINSSTANANLTIKTKGDINSLVIDKQGGSVTNLGSNAYIVLGGSSDIGTSNRTITTNGAASTEILIIAPRGGVTMITNPTAGDVNLNIGGLGAKSFGILAQITNGHSIIGGIGNGILNALKFIGNNGNVSSLNGAGLYIAGGDAYTTSGDGNGGDVEIRTGSRRVAGIGIDGIMTLTGLGGMTLTTTSTQVSRPFILTGFTSYTLNLGSDQTGDVYYRNSSGNLVRLPIGAPGQFIGVASGVPVYATPAGGGGGGTPAGVNTEMQINNAGAFGGGKIFVSTPGNLTMGDSGLTGNRTIAVSSSSAVSDLYFTAKGASGKYSFNFNNGIANTLDFIAYGANGVHIKLASNELMLLNNTVQLFSGSNATLLIGDYSLSNNKFIYIGAHQSVIETVQVAAQVGTSGVVNGNSLYLTAGNAYSSTGNGNGGDIRITVGQRRLAGSGTDGKLILDPLTKFIQVPNTTSFIGVTVLADTAAMFVNDYVAGAAAFHFKSERGDVVRLISGNFGFAYNVTNVVTRRTFDASNYTMQQLADLVGTMLNDIQQTGILV